MSLPTPLESSTVLAQSAIVRRRALFLAVIAILELWLLRSERASYVKVIALQQYDVRSVTVCTIMLGLLALFGVGCAALGRDVYRLGTMPTAATRTAQGVRALSIGVGGVLVGVGLLLATIAVGAGVLLWQ